MATGVDGLSGSGLPRLLDAAVWLGLDRDSAQAWLATSVKTVAESWEVRLRDATAPILADQESMDRLVAATRPSFAYAEQLARRWR